MAFWPEAGADVFFGYIIKDSMNIETD